MKKLSLLMFAILILGCENQNPVLEPKEDLSEIQAVADQLSQAAASLDLSAPVITESSVADGDTDVDPEPLNDDGIVITFSERISLSHFNLRHEEGYPLDWKMRWYANAQTVILTPPNPCDILDNGTTYVIDFVVQDFGSWKTEDTITFTTKPAGPAAPALDFDPPRIESVNMWKWLDADNRVSPEPVNQHGITIVFDQDIAKSHFDLTLIAPNLDLQMLPPLERPSLPDGLTLGWIAKWSDPRTVTLTPPPYACSMLQKGATYRLIIGLVPSHCYSWEPQSFIFFTRTE